MCEYTDGCTLSDDALALQLWEQVKRKRINPEHTVECPEDRRLLAAVVHHDGGRWLVMPSYRIAKALVPGQVRTTLFIGHRPKGGAGYAGYTHQHAGAIPEADWETDRLFYMRCRCGLYQLTEGRMIEACSDE